MDCDQEEILLVSSKTGAGVDELLKEIVKQIPSPKSEPKNDSVRALVFDFEYSVHRGVIIYEEF